MSEDMVNQVIAEPPAVTQEAVVAAETAPPSLEVNPQPAEAEIPLAEIAVGEASPKIENPAEWVRDKLLGRRKADPIPDAAPPEDEAAKVEKLGIFIPDATFENATISLTEDGRVEASITNYGDESDEILIRVSPAKAARLIAATI